MALPTESDLIDAGTTTAEMKVALAGLRNFIANLLGTTETVEAARSSLGAGTVGDALFTAETEADARAAMPIQSATVVNLSGTSVSFTGIPSWVKRITITFSGLSLSGSALPLLRVGDAGGIEVSAYTASVAQVASGGAVSTDSLSTAFVLVASAGASASLSGAVTLVLHNPSTNTWVLSGSSIFSSGTTAASYGVKSLSETLTQVQFTTTNGTDTFDAGTASILYE
jgi:hypothetical protein